MDNNLIFQLPQSDIKKKSDLGGKAGSVNVLLENGINVPKSYVLTSRAFKSFVEYNDLPWIDSSFLKNLATVHDTEGTLARIAKSYSDAEIPPMIKSGIEIFINSVDINLFAIRSSANCEDGESVSWAGQFQSFLNISKDQVLTNILNCWVSVVSKQVISYARKNENTVSAIYMSVLLQSMVPSDISGVCFTVNPITLDDSEILIECCEGLGEVLVSGQIIPSLYILDKKNGDVKKYRSGQQKKKIIAGFNASITEGMFPPVSLSNEQLEILFKKVREIEKIYRRPQDIEWSFVGNDLFILQSRNITTL